MTKYLARSFRSYTPLVLRASFQSLTLPLLLYASLVGSSYKETAAMRVSPFHWSTKFSQSVESCELPRYPRLLQSG